MVTPINELGKRIQEAKDLANEYLQRLDAIRDLLNALEDQKRGLENEKEALSKLGEAVLGLPSFGVPGKSGTAAKRKRNYGKPNTQLYEEIILEHGKPMHMSGILEEALKRGLKFKGKRRPVIQMRTALANCKRLYNVGGNIWWVIDKPLPEERSVANGQPKVIRVPTVNSRLASVSPAQRSFTD